MIEKINGIKMIKKIEGVPYDECDELFELTLEEKRKSQHGYRGVEESVAQGLDDGDKNLVRITHMAPGTVFKFGGYEFIVLFRTIDGAKVILKEVLPIKEFGDTNKFVGSAAETECIRFKESLRENLTEDIFDTVCVNMYSLDGDDSYGIEMREVGLLSMVDYWAYSKVLNNFPLGCSWFLSTPYSTPERGKIYDKMICIVRRDGTIGWAPCKSSYSFLRPVFVIKPDYFFEVVKNSE
jgi:hypothetical protein